ncbi:MAG TPA: hypothetical protein PKE15_05005 [Ottowia sp.]|nr:hypothetical protein [Ottowia sp.]
MSDALIFTRAHDGTEPAGPVFESTAYMPGAMVSVRVWGKSDRITLATNGHALHCGMVFSAERARAVAAELLAAAAAVDVARGRA